MKAVRPAQGDYAERNKAIRQAREHGATFAQLAQQYAISPSRVRAIVIHLHNLQRWYGPSFDPRRDCISLKDAASFLGISYSALRSLKDLPIERLGSQGRSWIRKTNLANWLNARANTFRAQAQHCEAQALSLISNPDLNPPISPGL